jgi:hypothetical protein
MNLWMQEDLSRKWVRRTQSSEQIVTNHDKTNLEGSRITVEDLPPKIWPNGAESGSASPTPRPASLWDLHVNLRFKYQFSTAS